MEISGKGVFVTGGAQGIGRGYVEALLDKGAKVLFVDISSEQGETTFTELRAKYGDGRVIFRQCDVTQDDQLEGAFQAAAKEFGAVDICVNNAGIVDEKNWKRTIQINTVAQIRGCQLAFEHMRRDRGGRGGVIVCTVSSLGVEPGFFAPVYAASKHAMIGFITSWAQNPRAKEIGVRWRAICPEAVETKLLTEYTDTQFEEPDAVRQILAGKWDSMLQVRDIAKFFVQAVEADTDDVIFVIRGPMAGKFSRRQLVDTDGCSDPY